MNVIANTVRALLRVGRSALRGEVISQFSRLLADATLRTDLNLHERAPPVAVSCHRRGHELSNKRPAWLEQNATGVRGSSGRRAAR